MHRSICFILTLAVTALHVVPADAWSDSDSGIEQLVVELGDASFARRTAAAQTLRSMGFAAIPGLRRAEQHSDLEVRWRAQRIRQVIEQVDFEQNLTVFQERPCVETASCLPGWTAYTVVVGTCDAALELFGRMQAAEPKLMREFEAGGLDLAIDVARRTNEVQNMYRVRSAADQAATEDQERRDRVVGSICSLLLIQSCADVRLNDATATYTFSLVDFAEFRSAYADEQLKPVLRQLLNHWYPVTEALKPYKRLMFAMKMELPQGLVHARDAIAQHPNDPRTQYALLTIARLGDRDASELLEAQLANATSVMPKQNRAAAPAGVVTQNGHDCRLGDVALAVLWHLHGEDPREHGFPRILKSRSNDYVFVANTAGFDTEEQRAAAIREWLQWKSQR